MSRIRVTMMALFATFALSAVIAGSASADWFVNGAKLTGSAALSTTAKVDATTTLLVPALKLSVVCSGSLLDGLGPEIVAPNTGKAKGLTFLSCNTTAPATGCALNEVNQPIKTNGVNAVVSLLGGTEDRVAFTPQTKNTFAEIAFSESNTCVFTGLEPVKGAAVVGAPTGQAESVFQSITGLGSTENNSLEIGSGNKAFLDGGNALLTLANGSKWSFK